MREDLIEDILDRLHEHKVLLPAKLRAQIEREIRRDWGRESHYVRANGEQGVYAECTERARRIRLDFARGERVQLLARRYGLSERRIQQIVAAK